jgi:acyl dehydratase
MNETIVPGMRLPLWRVTAANDAVDSANPIHDDTIAKRYGFRGGLVPGVTVFGYLMHPLIATFGREFLHAGRVDVRFRRPIYEGETAEVATQITASDAGATTIDLSVRNPAGEACAIATAYYPVTAPTAPPPPVAPVPTTKRPATPEELRRDPVFGTFHETFDASRAPEYLAVLGETLPVFTEVAHPAWLLRQANYLVDRNLVLGPWIHVGSEIHFLGEVHPGERLAVRGRVIALNERNGNDYADIDCLMETTRPVMRVLHRAIYRMSAQGAETGA